MANRLIVRGAKIDYVNRNGNTALHLCINMKLTDSVRFLLYKNANKHIMDLSGEDACDKAQRNGLSIEFPEFNDCNISKKIIPMLPDGTYADMENIPQFQKQADQIQ